MSTLDTLSAFPQFGANGPFGADFGPRSRCLLVGLLGVVLLGIAASPAAAVVVSTTQGNTSPPPASFLWDYVGRRGADSATYIGNGWAVASAHTGAGTVTLPSGEYDAVPGSAVQLHNPSGLGLSSLTDLVMFRLQTDPGLAPLEISATPPPIGSEALMIGRGRSRSASEVAWDVDDSVSPPDWTVTSPPGDFRGFTTTSTQSMRWGTNIIEDEDPLFGESDPDHNHIYSAGEGHVVSLVTLFDETGGTPFEAYAVSGDSGGPVYYQNGSTWELAGVMNASATFEGQPDLTAVYGNAALLLDLSHYRDEILEIRGPIVPEPSSLALAMLGAVAFWPLVRRWRS